MKIAVIITCHNRLKKTVSCLEALFKNNLPENVTLEVILVDDGSTDGTSEVVGKEFPEVRLIRGDGSLFWNRGMNVAFGNALKANFDAYLWLNDDTFLDKSAISTLIDSFLALKRDLGAPSIVVGSTRDEFGQLSYGGSVSINRMRRFNYLKVWNAKKPVECDVMNGNCVLIPDSIARVVGNIDIEYEHAMGDIDYALRARQNGFRIFVAPGFVGRCSKNSIKDSFRDQSKGLRFRWNDLIGRKGLPFKSWYRFTRRHGGPVWLAYFLWPYCRVLLSAIHLKR